MARSPFTPSRVSLDVCVSQRWRKKTWQKTTLVQKAVCAVVRRNIKGERVKRVGV
jgi:hypothetical protein